MYAIDHPLYRRWRGMRERCTNPAVRFHKNYGGRGITICPMWEHFWTFVFDMGALPSAKHSIDRIDNNGPYSPENCRWATYTEQSWNSKRARLITHNGETMSLRAWAIKLGIDQHTLSYRAKRVGYLEAVKLGGKLNNKRIAKTVGRP
jgi:hypothetical protein